MSDRQISPEHETAAAAFNSRREQDASNWNQQAQQRSGGYFGSPIVARPDGGAELHSQVSQDVSESWKEPENVTHIESHPGFNRVESNDSPVATESKSVEQEVGEVLTAEALHPFEEVQKLNEYMDKLVGDPQSFQQNTIDTVKFLSTPGITANTKETLASILLQELQNPNRPVNIENVNDYLAALATFKNEESKLWQSTLVSEGTRVVHEKFQHVTKNRATNTATPAAPEVSAPAEVKPATPLKTAYEVAEEKTGGPIKQAEAVATQAPLVEAATTPQATEAPQPTVAAPEQTASPTAEQQLLNEANEKLKAEIEAELDKQAKLTTEIQADWRNLPPTALNSLALSRLPKMAGYLDLDAFRTQLEQRMDNSHLQSNSEFAGLKGEGLEVDLARAQRITGEFEKLRHTIEEAKLDSPEVAKGVAEADEIKARYAKRREKMEAKLQKHMVGKPWLKDLIKLDPHVQKNPYFSKYGQNELSI